MREWHSKYNSFNSDKGLTYYNHYKQIMAWMDGNNHLPPPIEVNLDPMAHCNLSCSFCIVQRYLKHNREEIGDMTRLPTDYMYRLVDFLHEWGVKGLCISGGGEPTLHGGVWGLPRYANSKGMKVSIFTNATTLDDPKVEDLLWCQWIALSVDAGTRETYKKVKGKDWFDKITHNIKILANTRSRKHYNANLCYKFLIVPENMGEIHRACKLAKELGVQDFHARPADLERKDMGCSPNLDTELITEEFEKCHEEETEDFHVYTVTHKFDENFHVKHDFTRCLATPIMLPILTDGNGYLCPDKKMEAKFRLGSAYPDPKSILDWWGSDKHRELVKSVNIDNCSRCTWCRYNKQIEDVVIKDNMCVSFP